jgi:purine-nucleoside phosphorylase
MNARDLLLQHKAYDTFRNRFPKLDATRAIICGSGWSGIADELDTVFSVSFSEIPGLGKAGVAGHSGEIAWCRDGDTSVLIFKGRRHFYEGEGWTPVAIPVFLCKEAGIRELLLTNSAGAVNADFQVGDLMMITDHLNFIGDNPLVGPHHATWGPRFPDLSHIYGDSGQHRLRAAGQQAGVNLHTGIYAATRGPVYETPAEVRAWKALGADAVGMSTVPEAILAHAAGIEVSAVSCLTNFAAGISPQPLSHEEVTATTAASMPKMRALLREWIRG